MIWRTGTLDYSSGRTDTSVFKLDSVHGIYNASERYAGNDIMPASLLGDLVIDMKYVFAE